MYHNTNGHRPNHSVVAFSMELKLKPRSPLMVFDLISYMGTSARRQPESVDAMVL